MNAANEGRLVPLGEIVGTHGVGGLLRLNPYSSVSAALAAAHTVFLSPRPPTRSSVAAGEAVPSPAPRALTLRSAQPHGRVHLLRFEGVDTIDAAEALVGTVLAVAEGDLPPPGPREFYAYQLEGLEVVTVGGDHLGTVESLIPTGSNEVLVVRDGTREHLIPVIEDVIRAIDLDGGRVVIAPLKGMLE